MTLKEAKIHIRTELKTLYPENEINAFIRILFEDLLGISNVIYASNPAFELSEDQTRAMVNAAERLKHEEPIQHIIGFTYFSGFKIAVDKNILIPRPETEEMVNRIVNDRGSNELLKVLDIGTGSGCIAIALASLLKEAKVFALDISDKALDVAKRNALENGVHIRFIQGDVFSDIPELLPACFDLIVSNPPYVCESEKEKMAKNVLDFDPALALFVKDDEPLVFYERIVRYASLLLKTGGSLYVEINERFSNEVSGLFKQARFVDVNIDKDIHGKDRFVSGCKPLED